MNLKQLVLDKIEELGYDKAAEYFESKPATLRSWKSTGKIPMAAAEKVLQEQGEEEGDLIPDDATVPAARVAGPASLTEIYNQQGHEPTWNEQVDDVVGQLIMLTNSLAERIQFLESGGTPAMQRAVSQIVPPPSMRGSGQQVFEPAPGDSNAGSMVRPQGAVIGGIGSGIQRDTRASNSWLKPRPPQQSVIMRQ